MEEQAARSRKILTASFDSSSLSLLTVALRLMTAIYVATRRLRNTRYTQGVYLVHNIEGGTQTEAEKISNCGWCQNACEPMAAFKYAVECSSNVFKCGNLYAMNNQQNGLGCN